MNTTPQAPITPGGTSPRKFPWATLLGNGATILGATALGYWGGGLLAHALATSSLGQHFNALPVSQQHKLMGGLVGAAGAMGASAASIAHRVGQVRLENEVERLAREREAAAAAGNPKLASALDAYGTALRVYR